MWAGSENDVPAVALDPGSFLVQETMECLWQEMLKAHVWILVAAHSQWPWPYWEQGECHLCWWIVYLQRCACYLLGKAKVCISCKGMSEVGMGTNLLMNLYLLSHREIQSFTYLPKVWLFTIKSVYQVQCNQGFEVLRMNSTEYHFYKILHVLQQSWS